MANLAESSGYTLVDLPCGYTPRAIAFAKKGLPYYGLDLPVVIREISERIKALVPPEGRELVRYREVDATNYASLEKALDDIDGEVCITTEGLLMYFTDSEAGALCDNVRRILQKKGGCWYVADVESALQYVIVMRALVGDRFMEIMRNATQQTKDKSDVEIGRNALIASPADMPGSIGNAMAFLARHGLKAERVTVAEHMPELDSLDKVSPEQAVAVREGMRHCAFWRITPNGTAVALPPTEAKGFHVDASIQDGTLSLALAGRLDTITAPSLLSFFEKTRSEQLVSAVEVDCGRLDYVSSAGLRVLLIMHKACEGGVSLRAANEVVSEIMSQTGFDSIFH
jgi:anti-anti-sigma factor